jgi:hypothetical protein
MKSIVIASLLAVSLGSTLEMFERKINMSSGALGVIKLFESMESKVITEEKEQLNNSTLTYSKAIGNGYVVELPADVEYPGKSQDTLTYNIKKLDQFIENVEKLKRDKIRIVKYAYDGGKVWVNKLYDLEFNGQSIEMTVYDTYSNPEEFIKSPKTFEKRVIKKDYPNDLWYGICSNNNDDKECGTLISLKKSSVVQ